MAEWRAMVTADPMVIAELPGEAAFKARLQRSGHLEDGCLPTSRCASTLCCMTDAVIRRAEHADLAAVVQLRREWAQEEHGDIADPDFGEHLAAWFARELSRRIMWLAEEGGRPVGMMNLAIYERMPRPGRALSRWGYLGNVFVLAAYRNRGIGSRLVGAALNYADENGFVRVVLSPTERSIPLYDRAGFGPADALMLRTPPQAPGRLRR
jgi:GNAT superfamily N-acetyltransferase